MMVISRTKYEASEAEIRELFSFHKDGNVVDTVLKLPPYVLRLLNHPVTEQINSLSTV